MISRECDDGPVKRSSIRISLMLAVLSLLVVASGAGAGERPFKGGGGGMLSLSPAQFQARGKVVHLGRCSLTVNLDQSSLDSGEIHPYLCSFTAASGDVLVANVVSWSFDYETGVLAATISFRPMQDGRFDDATGNAKLLIVFDDWTDIFGNLSFTFAVQGTIDY